MSIRNPRSYSQFTEEIDLIKSRQFEKAGERLSAHLLDAGASPQTWRLLAEVANGSRNFTEAKICINKALELDPSNEYYKYRLGQILRNCREYDAADVILRQVLEANQNDPECLDGLKVCNYHLGNHEAARNFGQRSILQKNLRTGASVEASPNASEQKFRTKKIISYSLWGNNPIYVYGALINAALNKYFYPDWESRFYTGNDVPDVVVDALKLRGCEVVEASVTYNEISPHMWRFLVADDSDVSTFICRDCDSRPTVREVVAVEEWLASELLAHIIRDHIFHNDLILAGLWGARTSMQLDIKERIYKFQAENRSRFYGHDQLFLESQIWPTIKQSCLAHDSFYEVNQNCKQISIPVRNIELNHIGSCRNNLKAILKEMQSLGISEMKSVPIPRRRKVQAVISTN
ncbi:MAG: hypothetical protein GKR97_07115 [Rhizobiaceae bacterium]|nr:hypothetical protein [Rhizobiaceae bacterium]